MHGIRKYLIWSVIFCGTLFSGYINVFALTIAETSQYEIKIDIIITKFDKKLDRLGLDDEGKINQYNKIIKKIIILKNKKGLSKKNKDIIIILESVINKQIELLADQEINLDSLFDIQGDSESQDIQNNTHINSNINTGTASNVSSTQGNTNELFPSGLGNLGGNINNGNRGMVSGDSERFYFVDRNNVANAIGLDIYSMKIDGTDHKKLNEDQCWFINVSNDWIYYVGDDNSIFKMKKDGSNLTKLLPDGIGGKNLVLSGDWLYFLRHDRFRKNQNVIYKIKTDGSDLSIVGDFTTSQASILLVNEDYVYYKRLGFLGFYRMKTDGSELEKINESNLGNVNLTKNKFYYLNQNKGYKLYKMDLDGSNEQLVTEDNIGSIRGITVSGDWIYYRNQTDRDKLYKINIDGTQKKKLTTDGTSMVNVVGDWIFYANLDKDDKTYKIKTDGTQNQILN